jgi:hypothetical protein
MRILLDSRDLIAVVERQRPITPQQADEYLRSNGHELVFTFTNIRELVAPLATGSDFLTDGIKHWLRFQKVVGRL